MVLYISKVIKSLKKLAIYNALLLTSNRYITQVSENTAPPRSHVSRVPIITTVPLTRIFFKINE